MIIANQPWSDHNIILLEPVVDDDDIGYMSGPFCGVDVSTVSVVEIVIARDEIESFKCRTELFQGTQAVLQGLHVDRRSVMAPVAKEHAGFAAMFSGSGDEPVDKSLTVLIVYEAIALQSKVDVSENSGLAE